MAAKLKIIQVDSNNLDTKLINFFIRIFSKVKIFFTMKSFFVNNSQ